MKPVYEECLKEEIGSECRCPACTEALFCEAESKGESR